LDSPPPSAASGGLLVGIPWTFKRMCHACRRSLSIIIDLALELVGASFFMTVPSLPRTVPSNVLPSISFCRIRRHTGCVGKYGMKCFLQVSVPLTTVLRQHILDLCRRHSRLRQGLLRSPSLIHETRPSRFSVIISPSLIHLINRSHRRHAFRLVGPPKIELKIFHSLRSASRTYVLPLPPPRVFVGALTLFSHAHRFLMPRR